MAKGNYVSKIAQTAQSFQAKEREEKPSVSTNKEKEPQEIAAISTEPSEKATKFSDEKPVIIPADTEIKRKPGRPQTADSRRHVNMNIPEDLYNDLMVAKSLYTNGNLTEYIVQVLREEMKKHEDDAMFRQMKAWKQK